MIDGQGPASEDALERGVDDVELALSGGAEHAEGEVGDLWRQSAGDRRGSPFVVGNGDSGNRATREPTEDRGDVAKVIVTRETVTDEVPPTLVPREAKPKKKSA